MTRKSSHRSNRPKPGASKRAPASGAKSATSKARPADPGAKAGPRQSRPAATSQHDWIGRALPRAGILPPDEAERAIREGRITIDGRVVTQPITLLPPGASVRLDGHRIDVTFRTLALMFHKPTGCLTSTRMQRLVPTVFDLLLPTLTPELSAFHWHAVGRLDRDTTGLLLFTNDERLVGYVTDPASRIPKRYVARVQGGAEEEKVEPLRRGIQLEDGPTRPARVRIVDPRTVEVELTEGRHHQVKRLLGAVGLPVNALHRAAVGGLELDVELGAWREVTREELVQSLGFTP
jgi:pseudouridine synthase